MRVALPLRHAGSRVNKRRGPQPPRGWRAPLAECSLFYWSYFIDTGAAVFVQSISRLNARPEWRGAERVKMQTRAAIPRPLQAARWAAISLWGAFSGFTIQVEFLGYSLHFGDRDESLDLVTLPLRLEIGPILLEPRHIQASSGIHQCHFIRNL